MPFIYSLHAYKNDFGEGMFYLRVIFKNLWKKNTKLTKNRIMSVHHLAVLLQLVPPK